MRASLCGLKQLANIISFVCMLNAVGLVYADGILKDQESSTATSFPSDKGAPPPNCQPQVNHPSVLLSDGRLLVAGGMETISTTVDKKIEENSALWSPQSGEWQVLPQELEFDSYQHVFLNQLNNGRVLFFIVRDRGEYENPEYQAKLWNPQKNEVELISPEIKPRQDADVAVLRDGRVLLINGSDGSADLWDSRNNTLEHHEVTEFENSRWRVLALKNGNALALKETYGANKAKKVTHQSMVFLWEQKNGEWKGIASLPETFGKNNQLIEMASGSIQAKVAETQYELSSLDKTWEVTNKEMQPLLCKDSTPPNMEQMVAASSVMVPQAVVRNQAAPAMEMPQQNNILNGLNELKWLLLAVVLPIFMYLGIRKLNDSQQALFLKYANKIFKGILFFVFIFCLLNIAS